MNREDELTVTVDDEKGVRTYLCDGLDCHLVTEYERYGEYC